MVYRGGALKKKSVQIARMIIIAVKTISFISLAIGLILTFCLKNNQLRRWTLSYYPSYKLAQNGIEVLKNMEYVINEGTDKENHIGVIDIANPSWNVFLDFIQSKTAFLKSERNQPIDAALNPGESQKAGNEEAEDQPLEPINWDRIKTISAIRLGVLKAGDKPLIAPYRLVVFWPARTVRRVYEFYSFDELQSDMEKVLIGRLEYFAAGIGSGIIRYWNNCHINQPLCLT